MIRQLLKKSPFLVKGYKKIKGKRDERNSFHFRGTFENRSHNAKYLCIVLAGYKPFLMEDVFGRIRAFQRDSMDMCIVTSGMYSDRIATLCGEYGWSYLSTKENNVSLVQNVAIRLHPSAEYIFKLDEDIFITSGYFDRMLLAYNQAMKSAYFPGIVAPLLNVNGYSYVRILKKLGIQETYADKFEYPKYAAGADRALEYDPKAAAFMWGEGGFVPQIDRLNEIVWKDPHEVLACPIRFSIGAILFSRALWEKMGYFRVDRRTNAMGADEAQICAYCLLESKPIMVSENIVVGHFSFGPQTKEMKQFYESNRDIFQIHDTQSN